MTARMLVHERGLRDTRRNRRWLALVGFFSENQYTRSQEQSENLAWAVIRLWETTP